MTDQDQDKLPDRRQNRLVAVQFLYMWEFNPSDDVRLSIDLFFKLLEIYKTHHKFALELMTGVVEHLDTIDPIIEKHSTNWSFNRIAKTDLAILRLAIYELMYRQDIPPIVSINEAIDLAKILSNPDSKRFVNGILDKVKQTLSRPLRSSNK